MDHLMGNIQINRKITKKLIEITKITENIHQTSQNILVKRIKIMCKSQNEK